MSAAIAYYLLIIKIRLKMMQVRMEGYAAINLIKVIDWPSNGPDHVCCQAALTVLRNLPTSSFRRLLSLDSDFAAERTCDEADPVSLAPRCTSVM